MQHRGQSLEIPNTLPPQNLTECWSLAASESAYCRPEKLGLRSGQSSAKRAFITCCNERVNPEPEICKCSKIMSPWVQHGNRGRSMPWALPLPPAIGAAMDVCFHEKTWGERENAFASARRVDAKKVKRASPREWTRTNIKLIDSLIPQAA